MGADEATRAVLKDLAREHALSRGSDDIALVRAAYDRVFSSWTSGASAPTREEWIDIGAGPRNARALLVQPADAFAARGVIVFVHGGGWSLGSALCYAPLCRHLAAESGLRVIAPDFPQAPENPYPAAFEFLVTVSMRLESEYGGPLFFAGDSAGGTLAAALSADRRLSERVAGQTLFYPVLDLRPNAQYRSRRRLGTGRYFLSEAGILNAAAMYCGERGNPEDAALSPILSKDISAAPPTFLLIPNLDPLRDEAEKYDALLRKSGVRVETFHARNTIHGCVSFSGRIPQGLDGLKHAARFIKDLSGSRGPAPR